MITEADIHPSASRELEEAALFYDHRLQGLGEQFLLVVERAIEQVLLFPESAAWVGKSVRQKALPRFPYSLFYLFEKGTVFIVAVTHQKRAPAYWQDRLPH